MRIYLDNQLLVKSRVFSDEEKLKEKRERDKLPYGSTRREWEVFTWNSRGRLEGIADGTSDTNHNTIEVKLKRYEPPYRAGRDQRVKDPVVEFFEAYGLAPPGHRIFISAYNSFIETSKDTMMELIKTLENSGIFCLLPSIDSDYVGRAEYMSLEIKQWLAKPIEARL